MDFGKMLLGLIVALLVLWIIEKNAPQYGTLYVVILLLGIILANANKFTVFSNQISARLK